MSIYSPRNHIYRKQRVCKYQEQYELTNSLSIQYLWCIYIFKVGGCKEKKKEDEKRKRKRKRKRRYLQFYRLCMDVSTTLPSEAFFLYYSSIYQRIHYPFRAFHLVDLLLSTHTAYLNVSVHVLLLYISTLTLLSLCRHFTCYVFCQYLFLHAFLLILTHHLGQLDQKTTNIYRSSGNMDSGATITSLSKRIYIILREGR